MIAGTEYQQEAIRRARHEPAGNGETVPVLAVEDVIVHKLDRWQALSAARRGRG